MGKVLVSNNGYGVLSSGISAAATSLSLGSSEGARFPAISGGNFFFATLIDTSGNIEIVKVTARTGDSMTIVRGQDGTAARAWLANDRLELRPTKALFDALATLDENGDLDLGAGDITTTGVITGASLQGTVIGALGQNAFGTKTVSTASPSGGANGDTWGKY